MKELIKLLGLAENATKEEIIKVFTSLREDAAHIRSLFGLAETATHADLVEAVATLKKIPAAVAQFDPQAIAAKVAAGLTRDQAIEVLKAQAAHDALNPHDPVTTETQSEEAPAA